MQCCSILIFVSFSAIRSHHYRWKMIKRLLFTSFDDSLSLFTICSHGQSKTIRTEVHLCSPWVAACYSLYWLILCCIFLPKPKFPCECPMWCSTPVDDRCALLSINLHINRFISQFEINYFVFWYFFAVSFSFHFVFHLLFQWTTYISLKYIVCEIWLKLTNIITIFFSVFVQNKQQIDQFDTWNPSSLISIMILSCNWELFLPQVQRKRFRLQVDRWVMFNVHPFGFACMCMEK